MPLLEAKAFWVFSEARDNVVAVTSAGPYACRLHLAADR